MFSIGDNVRIIKSESREGADVGCVGKITHRFMGGHSYDYEVKFEQTIPHYTHDGVVAGRPKLYRYYLVNQLELEEDVENISEDELLNLF